MATCGHCGSHVSNQYLRVFGIKGVVGGCPACITPVAGATR